MNETQAQDPMSTDIGDIDTSYPVLCADIMEMEVYDAKVQPSKKGGKNYVVQFQTLKEQKRTNGEMQLPGLLISLNISLTETEKYKQPSIDKNLAKLAQWAKVRGLSIGDVRNDPALLTPKIKGVRGPIKVKLNKERTDEATGETYPEGNSIGDLVIIR